MSPRKKNDPPAGPAVHSGPPTPDLPPAGDLHHPYGPSALGRYALCPASYWLGIEAAEIGLADEPGEAAARGALLHSFLPDSAPEEPEGLSAEELEWLLEAREYLRSMGQGALRFGYEVRRELRHSGELVLFGTLDYEARFLERVVVVDLKFGRAEIHEELIQWQMRAYAAMALQADTGASLAQTFVFHVPTKRKYIGEIKREDLPTVEAAILGIITGIEASRGAPPRPHPAACHYCRARSICPALRKEVEALTRTDPSRALAPALSRALDFAAVVGPWAEEIRKKAREILKRGEKIPGWTLGERRNRRITDPLAALDAVHGVLDQAQFLEAVEVRLTALEKLCGKKLSGRDLEAKLAAMGALEVTVTEFLKKDGTDGT